MTGRFLEADADGWLINPAQASALQPEWMPALREVVVACRSEVGASFHSVYVRGSVASGDAVKGSSDLDVVLVLDDDGGERRPEWQHPLSERLLSHHPFITDVEVVVLGRGALLAPVGPVMVQWCFLLGTGARVLEGADLLPQLGRFRAGPGIAHVLRSLPREFRVFEARLAAARSDDERRRLCVWTCKKLLRSGAELAMLDDGRFTRDLAPCRVRFAKRLPEWSGAAQQLFDWAISPAADLAPLERIVHELEPVLCQRGREAGLVLEDPGT